MMDYINSLNLPEKVTAALISLFAIIQIVGALLEFKGKTVPEIMSIRKHIARKKAERKALAEMPETIAKVNKLLNNVKEHYDDDNIAKRNEWMKWVNNQFEQDEERTSEINEKLDKHYDYIIMLLVENKRNAIIDFASRVTDDNRYFTREQFNRIFKMYEEYEQIIEDNGLTNGEVNIAYRIITEAYEKNLKNRTFIEDIRGYD